MRQISLIYESEASLLKTIIENNISEERLLVLMFSDERLEKAKEIAKSVKNVLPNSILAGTSSAGLINQAQVLENRTLIILLEFNNISAKGVLLPRGDFSEPERAEEIIKRVCSDETKLLFLFQDGLAEKTHLLLKEISKLIPNTPLAGGKSGTLNNLAEKTYLFLNTDFINEGSLAISLNGDYLRVFQNYHFNWKKIGSAMKITQAEGNTVKTIDGLPAIKVYEKYLGKDFIEENNDYSELGFPFLLNRNGMEIARSFDHMKPDGTFVYHGDLRKGEHVHFGYGHIPSIIEGAYEGCREASSFQPEGILAFSCYARKILLEDDSKLEIEPYNKLAPIAGFFTFGEFFHKGKKNHLLNITMTMLMLSEKTLDEKNLLRPDLCPQEEVKFGRRSVISGTFIHLVEEVSRELEERNNLLKKMSHTDSMTSLYNYRFFLEALEHEVQRTLRHKNNLSVAILDLDNFKDVNDQYGHQTGDQVLKIIADKIKRSCRETDIVCRYGGDEFVVIFTETGINEAREVVERIRKNIYSLAFPDLDVSISVSCGLAELDIFSPKHLMKQADELLYQAKKNGKNSISCSEFY